MTDPPGSTAANLAALRALQAPAASPWEEDQGPPPRPRASRTRRVPQPVDRSALHGPLADMPRTREQAKTEGAPFYFLGLTCSRRHNAPRKTMSRLCVVCQDEDRKKARQKAYEATKREAKRAAAAEAKEKLRKELEAERQARKLARAQEKAAATRAARKAAKAAAKAAAEAAALAPPGPVVAPLPAPPEAAPQDDSAPWDVDPIALAPSPVVAAPPAAAFPFDPMSASPAPWDDATDINPFD